ncbi:hypothetical protein GGP45_001968 [Salinibacter ruber]|uniref:Uncharacterized protein n=1 Tax=Salinibacter ruber TaxID=146919 RepID=A0A9X2ZT08_9BACT|nr:hypothetical protein [Salinibacter ruber]
MAKDLKEKLIATKLGGRRRSYVIVDPTNTAGLSLSARK